MFTNRQEARGGNKRLHGVSVNMAERIRLASASSRRMEWLTEHLPNSIEINVKPLAGDEKISEGEVSSQVAFVLEDKITRAKIQYFLEKQNALDNNSISPPNIWIVGDTLVEDPNDVYTALGQPVDEISALRMLLDISGCRHLVWSATAIIDFRLEEPRIDRFLESSVVEFEKLDEHVLENLISSESWRGKAGGYDLAGPAKKYSKLIKGELVTVLGFSNEAIMHLREITLQI